MDDKKRTEISNMVDEENTTKKYFPQMLKPSNVLIVDSNCLTFHTFDMLRRILLFEKPFEMLVTEIPEMREFVQLDYMGQLKWAYSKLTPEICKQIFISKKAYTKAFIGYMKNEDNQATRTLLSQGLYTIFDNEHINGAVLQQEGDSYEHIYQTGKFKTYSAKDISDIESLVKFFVSGEYNAIMLDSVQTAAEIASQVKNTTFMIASYRWNFDSEGNLLRMEELTENELSNHNEFALFSPFNFTI